MGTGPNRESIRYYTGGAHARAPFLSVVDPLNSEKVPRQLAARRNAEALVEPRALVREMLWKRLELIGDPSRGGSPEAPRPNHLGVGLAVAARARQEAGGRERDREDSSPLEVLRDG